MIQNLQNLIFGNPNVSAFDDPMVIVVDTTKTLAGSSIATQWKFPQDPTVLDVYINFLVDWGDGSFSRILSKADASVPHDYAVGGIYEIKFYKPKGVPNLILGMRYENFQPERLKLLEIKSWGKFNNSRGCFYNCTNLRINSATGVTLVGPGESNFNGCRFTTISNLSSIVFTGTILNLFSLNTNFNQSFTLNAPNTTSGAGVLDGCSLFNKDLIINAPNITTVLFFFRNCIAFNKDVSNIGFPWSKITNMGGFMVGKSSANYNASYYDNLLIALDNAGKSNVPLGMGAIKYTSAGATARANLITKGWTITDGGLV